MINIFLLLGTVVIIFFSFALFAGMVVGVVHVIFSLVLLSFGKELEATLESVNVKRRTVGKRIVSDYHFTVSYADGRCVKTFTSKNRNTFHNIQPGSIVAIQVCTWCPGWAALSADLPNWNQVVIFAVVGSVLALVYFWVFRKIAFQILPSLLVKDGMKEEVSKYYVLGACMIILPAYMVCTFSALLKMEDTQRPTPSSQRSASPFTKARTIFASIIRSFEAERYDERSTDMEMKEMLPQRLHSPLPSLV